MKQGQVVNHKRYGIANVISIMKPNLDSNFRGGILLELSEEGLQKLNQDRDTLYVKGDNMLKRCFEDNLSLIKEIE